MAGGIQGAVAGVPSATSGVNAGTVGNIQPASPPMSQIQPVAPPTTQQPQPITSTDTSGGLGSILGSVIGTAANVYGSQNAGQAIGRADTAAINTQTQTLGNINNLFQPQTTLGSGAMKTLGSTLGTNGQPADYSNFLNMPGYKFAVDQGTQAIQRQAAASGNAWTPNTGAAIGQYVTGTAMQDYNTYVGQLQQAAGLGAQANNTLAGANLTVGGNISQLLQNGGMARASGVNNASGTVGNFLNSSAGKSLMNTAGNYISNWWNGSPGVSSSQWSGALSGLDNSTASTAASDAASSGMYSYGSDAVAAQNAASGASAVGDIAGAGGGAGVIGDLGLTGGADAAATTGGIDTMALAQSGYASLGGVPGSLAAADTSAGVGSATAAGGAETAGVSAGAAALPAAAMLAIAAHQNPTAFSQHYWDTLNASLAAGPGAGNSFGFNGYQGGGDLNSIKQYTGYEGAISSLANAYANTGKGNSTIPDSEWAVLAKYGITPATLANYNNSWSNAAANMPALMAENTASGIPNYISAGRQKL
jgi:hypothetical protein